MSENFDAIAHGMEPDAARLAFEALRPLIDAQTRPRADNIDVDRAVLCAASVGRMVRQPQMRAAFATLPTLAFDIAHVDRLESAALAMWYACTSLANARTQPARRVPAELHAQAVAVAKRMREVIDYNLGHVSEVARQLTITTPGRGYLRLAESLLLLADLYERHADTLAADHTRFQPADRTLAGSLAHAIHQRLGEPIRPAVLEWTRHRARAWALLVATYEEVRAAGRWLFRHENGDTLFPSLYTSGRGPRHRRTRAEIRAAKAQERQAAAARAQQSQPPAPPPNRTATSALPAERTATSALAADRTATNARPAEHTATSALAADHTAPAAAPARARPRTGDRPWRRRTFAGSRPLRRRRLAPTAAAPARTSDTRQSGRGRARAGMRRARSRPPDTPG